jgi:hypothetical protein
MLLLQSSFDAVGRAVSFARPFGMVRRCAARRIAPTTSVYEGASADGHGSIGI